MQHQFHIKSEPNEVHAVLPVSRTNLNNNNDTFLTPQSLFWKYSNNNQQANNGFGNNRSSSQLYHIYNNTTPNSVESGVCVCLI